MNIMRLSRAHSSGQRNPAGGEGMGGDKDEGGGENCEWPRVRERDATVAELGGVGGGLLERGRR
eukprot:scaffold65525_cov28-Tisochrysis_lutea.AAC.5